MGLTMKTIGIIGLGQMGLIHAKNLKDMGCEVIGVDPHFIGCFPGELYESVGRMMEDSASVDAVVVATPSRRHYVDINHAYDYGLPVFVEKPLADGIQFLPTMSKVLMTGSNMRYHPVIKVVKERMHELGGPYQGAWFLLHQEKQNAVDPVILNWGAHEVDLALYLLDRKLTPSPGAIVTHDTAEFILRFNSGPLVHFDLSYSGPNQRCFTIHGPNASIFADLDNFVIHIHSKDGREVIAVAGSLDQTYKDEMAEFLRRIDEPSTDGIGATGAEGLKCLELLLEVQKS